MCFFSGCRLCNKKKERKPLTFFLGVGCVPTASSNFCFPHANCTKKKVQATHAKKKATDTPSPPPSEESSKG